MFTVECPGCQASYQVDERRVPATGLRMRCPKCSTAFVVQKPMASEVDGAVDPAGDLPARVAPKPAGAPGIASPGLPPVAPARVPSPTLPKRIPPQIPKPEAIADDGVGLPAIMPENGASSTSAAVAPASPQRPKVPPRPQVTPAGQAPFAPPVPNRQPRPPAPALRPPIPAKDGPATPAEVTKAVPSHTAPGRHELDLPQVATRTAPSSHQRVHADQAVDSLEAGLPELRVPSERPEPLESDLPAAFGVRKPQNPAPIVASPVSGSRSGQQPDAQLEMDLPDTLSAHLREPLLPELARPGRASEPRFDLDLPRPTSPSIRQVPNTRSNPPQEVDDFEFDLPSPMQNQQILPELAPNRGMAERRHGTLPGGFELPDLDAELPRSSAEGIGLPSVPGRPGTAKKTLPGSGSHHAPTATAVALPTNASAPIEVDLGLDFDLGGDPDRSDATASRAGGGSFPPEFRGQMEPSLPPATGAAPAHRLGSGFELDMGGIDLPVVSTNFTQKRPRVSSAPPTSGAGVSAAVGGLGGTDYGEVSLESSEQELAVETAGDAARRSLSGDGLEFGAVPQAIESPEGAPGATGHTVEVGAATDAKPVMRVGAQDAPPKTPKSKRGRLLLAATLVSLAVGGSALTLAPDIGPFGAHFITDQLGRKQNDALVQRYEDLGHRVLANDDFSEVGKILGEVDSARRAHERLRALKAFEAYFVYAVELRHGSQPQIRARAKVILDELGERSDLKYVRLAAAARAAVEGNLARARSAIDAEISRESRGVDAQVISAEIALLEHRPADALVNWQLVATLESSARADFGVARSLFALGQLDASMAGAERAITKNASHVGARLLLARIALAKHGAAEAAEVNITAALALQAQQSTADFVLGKTLTGDLFLLRSRISLAEAAYQEALARDPRTAPALRGLGEALYRSGRYSESLARFEAGLQADPDDILVAVGAAKAQLALERVREAGTLLTRLRQANPKHYAVNYWHGKAEEAAGNRQEAEKAYSIAIEVGGTDPVVVDAYVAMALLKNQQGRREEAQKVLTIAQEKLPRMPKIHEAMGQLALAEGRYAAAVQNFNLAISLDPSDLGIKFRLGVALRKNREFEAAAKVFDEVTAADRDYPGLALERGQLFEASGQIEEALRAFESALAKAPSDPDLMLRVGCGKVTAGQAQQSEQLLKKVLDQRPTSAETHHCLGRAQLLEGSNLAMALRTLERAVELDPHRAEYHLYVGWAANEAGRVAVAEQSLKKALELDQGLGDAYWQRGILRYRQGAVKDAVADLTRALELRPGRYEAHAALADAYFDLGLEPKALEQWRLATHAQPDNATWRYRYGKLLQAAHRDVEAKPELEASLDLAAKVTQKPRWAWEAHHLLARAIGSHPSAVKHWQSFLELAPRDNVYRDEAKQALAKLGQPWDRD